jgi:DNA-directed RNA polymerase specialized sigma24 family protein
MATDTETGDSIPTRPSLLNRLKAGDDPASWIRFYEIYGPLIRGFAPKAGLGDDAAEEIVQETDISVSRHLPGFVYDPSVCAFKTWLLNLSSWRIKTELRRRRRHPSAGDLSRVIETALADRRPLVPAADLLRRRSRR